MRVNDDDRYQDSFKIDYMPDDLGEVMMEADCAKAWDYLESVLHISRVWRKDFEKEFLKQPRTVSKQEFFIRFTQQHIDPPLAALLRRNQSPVQAMLRFLFRDRLNMKKKEWNWRELESKNLYYQALREKKKKSER